MHVIIALAHPRANALADELSAEGHSASIPSNIADVRDDALHAADALVIDADRRTITAELVARCDRTGTRIVVIGRADARRLSRFGLADPLPDDAQPWDILAALQSDRPRTINEGARSQRRIIAVWGTTGAPGRSTLAIQLAVALARADRHTALIDADAVAPSLSLLLGLDDDAPGLAAACRRAENSALDVAELERIAHTLETSAGNVDVLVGLNRPSRWPELSYARVQRALGVCREWADDTVVDVASALESDAELASDMPSADRCAATRATLEAADLVIAVAAADPLSIARFVRDYAELRNLVGTTPVTVVINFVRPGPLGIDARGHIRRTLERFCGITDVVFLPYDRRAADAALLHARPMADVTPRAPFVRAVRLLADRIAARSAADATGDNSRGNSRAARRLRPKRGVRAESRLADDRVSAS